MAYYMRFVVASGKIPSLGDIGHALSQLELGYRLETTGAAAADLILRDTLIAEIEINQRGDGLLDDELEELLEQIEDADGDEAERVTATLRSAQAVVAARILFGGRDAEQVLDDVAPVWSYLFDNFAGLLQADDEGYYDGAELILAVE